MECCVLCEHLQPVSDKTLEVSNKQAMERVIVSRKPWFENNVAGLLQIEGKTKYGLPQITLDLVEPTSRNL